MFGHYGKESQGAGRQTNPEAGLGGCGHLVRQRSKSTAGGLYRALASFPHHPCFAAALLLIADITSGNAARKVICMPSATPDRRIIVFICLVSFFDAMGAGLILPVLPDLIRLLSDLTDSGAAKISGWLLFTYAGMQFFCAPILGGLSDRYGRRPVLLISLLGFSADFFIMALAPGLAFLFAARMTSGLFGATYAAASAVITDIAAPDARGGLFGLAGASVGLGFVAGPALGGLIGETDPRLPFILAGALTLAAFVYGWFAFPETHTPALRRPFSLGRANPLGSLIAMARLPGVLVMLAGLFCVQLANQSYASTWAFYTEAVAGWTPFGVGLSVAVYGAMLVLVQGGFAGPVIKRFGAATALIGGVVVGLISYTLLAFAVDGPGIYFAILVGGLSGLVFPAVQVLLTGAVTDNAQGELQGAISASYSLAAMLGPLVMAQSYAAWTDAQGPVFPGAPFVIAIALLVAALALFVSVRMRRAPKATP
jgi:MFS transporter, DHA1 family, tetracycline resistance protein